MKQYTLSGSEQDLPLTSYKENALQYWLYNHEKSAPPFYGPDTVVLGLDIGMEGIGICLRKGKNILFCKTISFTHPKSKPLANRNAFRTGRHTKHNRRVRMNRLKKLFKKYFLPWVSDEIMSRSDPYHLRHRAITKNLASAEALSICIRHIVGLRGYDYFALTEKGEYPWGTDPTLKTAKAWLKGTYVDEEYKKILTAPQLCESMLHNGKELGDSNMEDWRNAVEEQYEESKKKDIRSVLAEYARHKSNYRKGRGYNFPRRLMEQHLREIIRRQSHLIEQAEEFQNSLFLPCDTRENKKKAIFHYNRKTAEESRIHFNKKVKDCPYAEWLGLPAAKCATGEDPWIRRWKLADFLANRPFYLWKAGKDTTPAVKATLPESVIRLFIDSIPDNPEEKNHWRQLKSRLEAGLKQEGLDKLDSKKADKEQKEWNAMLLDQLKDLCAPSGNNKKKRASLSTTAARELYRRITREETCLDAAAMEQEKKDMGFYDKRKEVLLDYGLYPQVELLLGSWRYDIITGHPQQTKPGVLQKIFRDLAPALQSKSCPDYVVVECIKNPARTTDESRKIQKEQENRRKKKETLAAVYGQPAGSLSRARHLRLLLWQQQGGTPATPAVCPFTGISLGTTDPFSADLELAHLYPDSRGGLYIEENLVLTTRAINKAMENRTPVEAAMAGIFGRSADDMLHASHQFFWNERKRQLFSFVPTEDTSFPDFNNLTRVSQLASQLRKQMAFWMDIQDDTEAMRVRIGNPAGAYTDAARRSWLEDFHKDRSNTLHHRIDAAVLACIPPGTGINHVRYKGIFYSEPKEYVPPGTTEKKTIRQLRVLSSKLLPLPDFSPLLGIDREECPILKKRAQSKSRSLGDATFWRCDREGNTSQRTPMDNPADFKSASKVKELLLKMGIPEEQIPDPKYIERWIANAQPAVQGEETPNTELRLKNGAPVRSMHKWGSKGHLTNSPFSWSGLLSKSGKWDQLRSLNSTNDRMELWIGWDEKKKKWKYQTRVIPTREAMRALKRMGLPWKNLHGAPDYLKELLARKKGKSLRKLILGILPRHSVKILDLKKGDIFFLSFSYDEKKEPEKANQSLESWGEISSIMSSGQLQISCLTHKNTKKATPSSADKIAGLCQLPPAGEYARQKGWCKYDPL